MKMDNNLKEIFAQLREAEKEMSKYRLTKDMAAEANMSQPTFRAVLSGEANVTIGNLYNVCKVLGVDLIAKRNETSPKIKT
jgi:transcriptional regulator with XRE-family HTH domain